MNYLTLPQSKNDLKEFQLFVKEKVLNKAQERDSKKQFAWVLYREMFNKGWMDTFIPKKFGGKEWGLEELCFQFRDLAYGSSGMITTLVASLLGSTIVHENATLELSKKIFENYHKDFTLFSVAATEENSGFAIHKMETTSKKTDKGFIINGKKTYITNANHCKYICVLSQTTDEIGNSLGLSMFCIPANTPGVVIGQAFDKIGHRESNTGEIIFKDVFIPNENLIGKIGEGIKILGTCLNKSKLLIAASAVGVMHRSSELAIEHLSFRRMSGNQTLLDKPTIQQLLTRLYIKKEASWLLVIDAAKKWDEGCRELTLSNMAKLYSTDTAVECVNECIELVGARALCSSHELSRLYRDVKIYEIYEGSTQILEAQLSKSLFANKSSEISLRKREVA